jgi:hypothetical protein
MLNFFVNRSMRSVYTALTSAPESRRSNTAMSIFHELDLIPLNSRTDMSSSPGLHSWQQTAAQGSEVCINVKKEHNGNSIIAVVVIVVSVILVLLVVAVTIVVVVVVVEGERNSVI